MLSNSHRWILQAQTDAVFNKRESSNKAIDSVFSNGFSHLPDSLKQRLLDIRIINSVFLGNYKEAYHATQKLMTLDTAVQDDIEDYKNSLIIYEALKDAPKQTLTIKESDLPVIKDLAGLMRIPVSINGTAQQAVFDTGANLSVITDSLADKCGLTIINKTFKVDALTGQEVDSKIALADSLKIGHTILKNVVFLVFPKSSLSFPEANYHIDAIIGYPVINALKEIQIVNGSSLHIPEKQTEFYHQNMALDYLTPIVAVVQGKRSQPFTFDTGASSTQLYKSYFDLHEDIIRRNGIIDSVLIGGAGGSKLVAVYKSTFSGAIAHRPFEVDSVNIYFNDDLKAHEGVYGNIGMDIFQQFDTLTLNFDNMFLKLN